MSDYPRWLYKPGQGTHGAMLVNSPVEIPPGDWSDRPTGEAPPPPLTASPVREGSLDGLVVRLQAELRSRDETIATLQEALQNARIVADEWKARAESAQAVLAAMQAEVREAMAVGESAADEPETATGDFTIQHIPRAGPERRWRVKNAAGETLGEYASKEAAEAAIAAGF